MGKLLELLKESKLEIRIERTPPIINNYYILNDNRIIKVGEEEFKKITKNKKLINYKRGYLNE